MLYVLSVNDIVMHCFGPVVHKNSIFKLELIEFNGMIETNMIG